MQLHKIEGTNHIGSTRYKLDSEKEHKMNLKWILKKIMALPLDPLHTTHDPRPSHNLATCDITNDDTRYTTDDNQPNIQ